MRYLDILFEFNFNKTIQNYGDALLNRVKDDPSKNAILAMNDIDKILKLIIDADPTSKKAYTIWIIEKYLERKIRFLDDLGRTNLALSSYIDLKFKNKLRPEHKDINKINSLIELEELMDDYKANPNEAQSERQKEKELEENFYKNKEAILYYNDNDIKVVIPKTQEASCFFGRNTKWCTSARKENLFDYYKKRGPLYIVLLKKENKRFQFHFQTGQYIDDTDNEPSHEEWIRLQTKYPKLIDLFRPMGEKYHFIHLQ